MFYDIYNPIALMNFTETQPFNDNFDGLGMSSLCYFDCLGSMTVVFLFTAICQLLAPFVILIATITGCSEKRWFKKYKAGSDFLSQDKYSVANTWMTMLLETFMDILIACVLAFYSPSFIAMEGGTMNFWDKFNFWAAVVSASILALFTCLALYLFCYRFRFPVLKAKNKSRIEDNKKVIEYY